MTLALNWLWQGAVVAAATTAILRGLEPRRAAVRYRALGLAWVSVLVLPGVAWIRVAAAAASAHGAAIAQRPAIVSIPAGWWTSGTIALALWGAWCSVQAFRAARAACALRRTMRSCRGFPVDVEARLACWTRVGKTGRCARLVLADGVAAAAVLGCGRPLIGVAPRLLDELTDTELDAIVMHEWAHVQRRDDVAHLAQLLVRAVVGWHPALWWLDRHLRVEREVACDERAVAITGSAKAYATCLTKLASLTSRPPASALAALASSGLRQRIVRILSPAGAPAAASWRAVAVCTSLVPCLMAGLVAGVRLVVADARPATPAPAFAASERPLDAGRAIAVRPLDGDGRQAPVMHDVVAPDPFTNVAARDGGPATPAHPGGESPLFFSSPVAARPIAAEAVVPPGGPAALALAVPVTLESRTSIDRNEPLVAAPLSDAVQPPTIWGATADAGVAIGRTSEKAGIATAGFFTRVGKSIAGSF